MTAETPTRTPRAALRALAFRTFYGLPAGARRTLVRLGVGTYTVGAVVLAFQPDAEPTGTGTGTGTGAGTDPGVGVGDASPGWVGIGPVPPPGWLLMVRQPPGKGWSLPAGLLRRRERPVEGAAREFAEETGVTVATAALTPTIPNAVVHTRGRWIDMVFTTTVPADTPLRPDGQEILAAAWQRVDALPEVTPATARLLAHYGIGPYAEYPEAID